MPFSIQADDLSQTDITQLIQAHLDFAAHHTPAGSGHAFNIDALKQPDLTFWSARADKELLGCIALRELDASHSKIKSMHTAKIHRGRRVASTLLEHLENEAKRRGYFLTRHPDQLPG